MALTSKAVGGSRKTLIDAITALATSITTAALTVTGASSIDGASLTIDNLPTSDPGVPGAIWSDEGVLTVGPPAL